MPVVHVGDGFRSDPQCHARITAESSGSRQEAGEDGGIIVKVQFADAMAVELFRREFQGNYGD
jgi:hypothetical protein